MPPDETDAADDVVATLSSEAGVAVVHTAATGGRAPAWAIALLAGSSLIFSTGALFVRSLHDPQAWTTVFWRSVGAGITITLITAVRERRRAVAAFTGIGRAGIVVAATFAASSIAMVVALTKTSTAIVLVIFALSPLAAALFAWALIGEQIHGYTWAAIAVTVAGVGYMVSGTSHRGAIVGAAVAFVIPLAFGFGTVTIRRHHHVAMAPAMALSAVIAGLVALPFARATAVDRHDLVLLLLFGSAQLGIGLLTFSIGAARTPATEVALLSMLEPVAGPIWVWILKDEYPGVPALIGGATVFAALAAHTLYAASRAPTA